MIKLIIFDFDDTITDNVLLDYNAFLFPCKKLKIPCPNKSLIRSLRKRGFLAKEIIQYNSQIKNKYTVKTFLKERNNFLSDKNSFKFLKLKTNTKFLLYNLKRKNIKCILCTARKNKKTVMNFIKKNQISSYFSKFYFMEDLELSVDNLSRKKTCQ